MQARAFGGELTLQLDGDDPRHRPRWWRGDARRHVDRLVARWRGRVDGVWSNDDGYGCLVAALVAERLGLPGHAPAAVVRAQHKLAFRRALAATAPQWNVAAAALPFAFGGRRDAAAIERAMAEAGLAWPAFAKPMTGSFSVLARRVASPHELAAHLRLSFADRRALRALARPFAQLAAEVVPLPCPVEHVLVERPLAGTLVGVDGFSCDGTAHVFGIVDAWHYDDVRRGARHFAAFTVPSRQPDAVLQRVRTAARDAVAAVGLGHGLWNVELFVGADGDVRVVEVNPRGAGQLTTLHRDVTGIDVDGIAIALATGGDPFAVPRSEPVAEVAASFVFRRFDGSPGHVPGDAALRWLAQAHPEARLWLEPVPPRALRREYRWFGSHRHAVVNTSAADFAALRRLGAECERRLFGNVAGQGRGA